MHRALYILDIVQMICVAVSVGEHFPSTDSLASLARTCRVFMGPALDCLWERHCRLRHLIKCMPSDLWEETTQPLATEEFRLLRPLVPSDWDRLSMYTQRIRSFTYTGLPSDAELLQILSFSLPTQHLLPNLRDLTWMVQDNALFRYIGLFLSPKITTIHLFLGDSDSQLALLPCLLLTCPSLKEVFITSNFPPDHTLQRLALSFFVRGLAEPKILSLDSLDQAGLVHIAQLSTLDQLTLGIPEGFEPTHQWFGTAELPLFPALRSLHLRASKVEYATEMINQLSNSQLDIVVIDAKFLPFADTTAIFFLALATHLSHSAIRELTMQPTFHYRVGELASAVPSEAQLPLFVVTLAHLRPLFQLVNLTKVCLKPPVGFDLDDAAALELASAWPKLEHLTLQAGTSMQYRSKMTLHSLYAFAERCPLLKRLDIDFSATPVQPLPQHGAATRVVQHTLSVLLVGNGNISTAPEVAGYLSRIFPGLSEILTTREYHDNEPENVDSDDEEELAEIAWHKRWKEVEALLPVIAAARADERYWVQQEMQT
ncbi:hypothetical protein C8J57DRAFT_1502549 [Mycena rebaudengoi]|nr:hypothetical protein C8J57DRAFT_1502549 [Mycena rebaudengoi]